MRKIAYRTRTYHCRICSDEFEGYFVGRNWYCEPCRLDHFEAQRAAASWVARAIRAGVLMPARMLRCIDCGNWAHGWEHRDYDKPLEVDPTCTSCNFKRGPARFTPIFDSV